MKLNILVAEDDPHTRAALCEVLRGEGHSVIEAADGKEAQFRFDKKAPDLACLDVMMPGVSGFDLCRHFRKTHPKLPILFITAKSEEIDKVVGLELGADDYIVKPFGTKEVIARVRAVARRCIDGFSSEADEVHLSQQDFEMRGLAVMPRRMQACRGETTINLTAKELRILQILHSRPGEVISRETIFRTGWQEGPPPSTRTLDQTISNLRKRIEIDPKHPTIIETVYGVGYRYEPQP
ncbi:Alkaline phosphatase synthesis transcriptional regulatory protein PhoP [Rubripirellula amarantea]|uniref:Alkaline phosphatase synthesis transcriptional regulatory protein PhoP n=1 Tax=Rubripirellula amarantea TaxID=2527999 RepID=A0A5C5WT60_9BACT|nr:response regulator transcription factor [Rubripirellula amarantea]TWT53906.1 Alkaline phosphatase synthesis transcriptional regulatory protein PhoP [Rubripirellula amarantea]